MKLSFSEALSAAVGSLYLVSLAGPVRRLLGLWEGGGLTGPEGKLGGETSLDWWSLQVSPGRGVGDRKNVGEESD